MNRSKYVQLLFFIAAIPVMCLSIGNISAKSMDDAEGIVIVEKPMSYAEYIRTADPLDLIPVTDEEIPVVEPDDAPGKHIIVSLADQTMWVFEDYRIVGEFLVSTGTWGHRTPTGEYQVRNQAVRAYSNKYDAWMLHWMAITPDGAYGMHSLLGTSYLRRLGSVASHGCIRLSHEDAEWLYGWVDIGTPVQIVSDWVEPPEEKTLTFRTGKIYCF